MRARRKGRGRGEGALWLGGLLGLSLKSGKRKEQVLVKKVNNNTGKHISAHYM